MKPAFMAIGMLVIGALGWFLFGARQVHPMPDVDLSAPTNFNEVGILHFPPVTSGQSAGTFEYNDGTATVTKRLALDALSVCAAQSGATPCMAMSVTFDKPFDGKWALVEGTLEGDAILVRKLRAAEEGEELRSFEAGNVFISWPQAVQLFEACQVASAMQTHSLDVYLDLKDGRKLRAVEPTIDEMFNVIQRTGGTCGTFPVATE